jgi:hypothetical protein
VPKVTTKNFIQITARSDAKQNCNIKAGTIERENISGGPTFGDFVYPHRVTEYCIEDNTVARPHSTRVQTPLSPLY